MTTSAVARINLSMTHPLDKEGTLTDPHNYKIQGYKQLVRCLVFRCNSCNQEGTLCKIPDQLHWKHHLDMATNIAIMSTILYDINGWTNHALSWSSRTEGPRCTLYWRQSWIYTLMSNWTHSTRCEALVISKMANRTRNGMERGDRTVESRKTGYTVSLVRELS